MRYLPPRRRALARAVAGTIFDPGGGVPPERLDFFLCELEPFLARAGLQTRLAFRVAFLAVQLAPLLFLGRFSRFPSLSPQERLACLEALERSRLGLVLVVLKTCFCMLYYEHPDALAETGYDAQGLLGPAHRPGANPLAKKPALARGDGP